MIQRRTVLAAACATILSVPVAAQESGRFIVRLGRDTTAVETYTRKANRIVVDQVGRAPRVLTRHYEYEMNAAGAAVRAQATITSPLDAPGAPPVQRIETTFAGDSLTMESRRDTTV